MAEKERFELSRRLSTSTRFPGVRLKPLGHLSKNFYFKQYMSEFPTETFGNDTALRARQTAIQMLPQLFKTSIFQIFIIRNTYTIYTAARSQFNNTIGRSLH